MTDEQPSLVGKTLDERYRVTREMGRGAMGTVYEGRHALLGRRLAIKVLRRSCSTPAQRERFLHEARAAGAISHPHIVQVQDFGVAPGGAPYLVMEYVDGIDLQAHLEKQKQGWLPLDEALEICAQMLSALEVIHAAGLVHRDIKPANIMMARGSRHRIFAKLLDFGIARAINPVWQRPDLTRVDQVLGTPAYLSPEQAAGGQAVPGWDLWALATILYELLSGKLPFKLESLEQVTDDILNCRLVSLRSRRSDLPAWTYQVLERAHHPRADQRYATATSFLQAIETQNPRPEGAEGFSARTVPFLRVQLQTPPPQLMAELVGQGAERRTSSREDRTVAEPLGHRAQPKPFVEPDPTTRWPMASGLEAVASAPSSRSPVSPASTASSERLAADAGASAPPDPSFPPSSGTSSPGPHSMPRRVTGPLTPELPALILPPEVSPGSGATSAASWAERSAKSTEVPLPSTGMRSAVTDEGARDPKVRKASSSSAPEPARRFQNRQLARTRRKRLVMGALLLLVVSIALLVYLLLTRQT